ncbi:peptide deformylase [Roseobacter sp. CCS2]|uniref:peptide deformylase n=1 Tax=Roseobacter sp. CCS2 TaxID=391593 RepID=UPI0000F402FA|nr:peptide deformylase [Roseobacter sp. CCS2]EBA13525.1 formylmethionine deformylase [Roseobacter sp. CCS2]
MTHRPFVMWPHPALRTAATPVAVITDEVRAIWDEMIVAMDTMPGVGLAAPQLGVEMALAVIDASEERGQAIRMANPTILHSSVEPRVHEEGSPNLPGVWAKVTRPRAVTVRFLNADGQWDRQDFVGLWATSVQHQIDHLSGKMFFDHLTRVKRDMLIKKSAKLRRG